VSDVDAQTLNRATQDLAQLASSELIDVMLKAAEDDEVWTKAASDPRGFLKEGGVDVPDTAEIVLENHYLRNDPLPCREPGQVRVGKPGGRVCAKSIQLYVRKRHGEPFPTLKLCVKWETVPWVDGGCVPIESLLRK
jgi:hypothetical protein